MIDTKKMSYAQLRRAMATSMPDMPIYIKAKAELDFRHQQRMRRAALWGPLVAALGILVSRLV